MLIVAVLVPTLFHSLMGLTWVPLELAAMALTMLTIAVFSAWLGWGSRLLPASALFFIPAYVFNKIPMYVKFLTGRQRDWVRTGRK
jgi:hypothetical protein